LGKESGEKREAIGRGTRRRNFSLESAPSSQLDLTFRKGSIQGQLSAAKEGKKGRHHEREQESQNHHKRIWRGDDLKILLSYEGAKILSDHTMLPSHSMGITPSLEKEEVQGRRGWTPFVSD